MRKKQRRRRIADSTTVDLIGLSLRSKSQNMISAMISITLENSLSISAELKPTASLKDLGLRPTWRC